MLFLSGKEVLEKDENIIFYEMYPEATYYCETCSFISFNFQTIVYLQDASGKWKIELLKVIKDCETLNDLVEKQADMYIKKMDPKVILTLAGIKILKTQFKENIMEWRFVAAKAI